MRSNVSHSTRENLSIRLKKYRGSAIELNLTRYQGTVATIRSRGDSGLTDEAMSARGADYRYRARIGF